MLLQAAETHYSRQARLGIIARRNAERAWRNLPVGALDTWDPARLAQLVGTLQLAAARDADGYVTRALTEQGTDPQRVGSVNPAAFVMAGDGRSLVTLFDEPRIQAKQAIGEGTPAIEAWQSAGFSLQAMVATAVADAGRLAVGVSTAARPHADGQVRQLSPPSCARCAILAGRWYRWDAGFPRHPRCDCIGIPAAEDVAGDLLTDPAAAVRAGNVTGLSQAEMKAFNEGADLGQLVNIHRSGISTASVYGRTIKYTTEGTTRRGVAGKLLESQGATFPKAPGSRYARATSIPRLTPEQIYRDALDRADAVRLLRRFGYLI